MKPRHALHPYLMLAPTLALLTLFFLGPLAVAARQSLYAWDMLTPPRFVGMDNFRALAASGALTRTVGTTLAYAAMVVGGSMSVGLLLALAVDRPGRLAAFVRGAVFSAYVVSWVAVALLWMWLLDGDVGLVSRGLRALHLPTRAWLGDPSTALVTIAMVSVWKITGYAMVLFFAGLQDVPRSLIDAAALDGAGAWQRFRHVTWPVLRPTTAFVGTTSLLAAFQAFDVVRVMTQGGPAGATELIVYAIYEQVFVDLRVGRASALVVVLALVLVAATAAQLAVWRRRGAT